MKSTIDNSESLFKSHGVLWRTRLLRAGMESISETPLCPKSDCHTLLKILNDIEYYCVSCEKIFTMPKGRLQTFNDVTRKFEGHKTLGFNVYSLDLPPTKIIDEDREDENYWVQAKMTEKEGKKMAVVYFGERINGKQSQKDYSQIFLDFEDEQLRFDKSNKNPMKLLSKLTAEFQDSITEIRKPEQEK